MTTTITIRRSADASIAQALLNEFQVELATTRRFLERIPADKLSWKPHEKSMTAGQLALHIAELPAGVLQLALADTAEVPDFSAGRRQPDSREQALEILETGAAEVRQALSAVDNDRMLETFTVTRDGSEVMEVPRGEFLRLIMLNHWYHHRGQLGVYLRLLGAAVPSSYGPSGDESPFAA